MNIALILAGGTGTRIGGDVPKQYIEVGGQPIIAYCLQVLESHPMIDGIQIVADSGWCDDITCWVGNKLKGFSSPGENRQLSILNGLRDIRKYALDEDIVLIHDAARPLVSTKMISDCIEGCSEYDGVMPALPVKDTVYYGVDGCIESLLERNKVIAGQAPEAFRLGMYYRANEVLLPDKIYSINGSTEPAILAGLRVHYIPGDERNFKVTTRTDLERFEEIIAKEK